MKEIFHKYLKKNSTLIVGVSGGPDSVYLLIKCLEFQKDNSLEIIVAHVNHKLRGKDSDKDSEFVQNLAKKHNLKFEKIDLDLKKLKGNLEENARKYRYDFFEKLREKYHANFILTAHHHNDNIETAIFNLIRGSSFNGLKGIQIFSKDRHLLRPLLLTSKTEILEFLHNKKIPFRKDKSNNDLKFSRNLLRKKIIPSFKKINQNFEETFKYNLENFNEFADFLKEKSKSWLKKNSLIGARSARTKNRHFVLESKFLLNKFLAEPKFIQKNILSLLYENLYKNTAKLTHKQLDEILKVLNKKAANLKKEFGSNYFISVIKDKNQKRYVKTLKKSEK